MHATWIQAEREEEGNWDKLKLWNICKTAHLIFKLLINNVLHFAEKYKIVCTILRPQSDLTAVRVASRIIIDLNYLRQDK